MVTVTPTFLCSALLWLFAWKISCFKTLICPRRYTETEDTVTSLMNVHVHTLLLGKVLILRAVIGQRVDGGPVVLLLLVGAVGVVGGRAVTCGHLGETMNTNSKD